MKREELLHKFNETKDLAQSLLNLSSQHRGIPLSQVYKELSVEKKQ